MQRVRRHHLAPCTQDKTRIEATASLFIHFTQNTLPNCFSLSGSPSNGTLTLKMCTCTLSHLSLAFILIMASAAALLPHSTSANRRPAAQSKSTMSNTGYNQLQPTFHNIPDHDDAISDYNRFQMTQSCAIQLHPNNSNFTVSFNLEIAGSKHGDIDAHNHRHPLSSSYHHNDLWLRPSRHHTHRSSPHTLNNQPLQRLHTDPAYRRRHATTSRASTAPLTRATFGSCPSSTW